VTSVHSEREELTMAGLAIITEACIDVKDRACVDVCPVQCIYEYDDATNALVSEDEAGSGIIETTHRPNPEAIAVFGDSLLYVNLDECTSCTACYQPDVCPVGAIYSEEHVPDGSASSAKYNSADPNKGADHTFFIQHSRDVFAD
jgi:Fe-S-cluster-containing hydrogenase component 2